MAKVALLSWRSQPSYRQRYGCLNYGSHDEPEDVSKGNENGCFHAMHRLWDEPTLQPANVHQQRGDDDHLCINADVKKQGRMAQKETTRPKCEGAED
jgi:hypothetical protein